MTVTELITRLTEMNGDMEVHIAYNYGDHGRTIVAPKVRRLRLESVTHSEYHSMDRIVEEDREPDDMREVIVLTAGE